MKPVLASDIDGTLLPLDGNEDHQRDLAAIDELLQAGTIDLILVTGRDIGSTRQVVRESGLPWPRAMVVAMGTEIYECESARDSDPKEISAYQEHLHSLAPDFSTSDLAYLLRDIDGLSLRPGPKQGPFKLSYFAKPTASNDASGQDLTHVLSERVAQVEVRLQQSGAAAARVVSSINPVWQSAMIDVLPPDVSKAFAMDWWIQNANLDRESIIFAGDSGNDLDAFVAGYKTIVVANAGRALAMQAFDAHENIGIANRLRFSPQSATSGVREGLEWFGATEEGGVRPPEDIGATVISHDSTHFRVWAPRKKSIIVHRDGGSRDEDKFALEKQPDGYFTGTARGFASGERYRLIVNEQHSHPDPASRYQPNGVHEASQIDDHERYPWQDGCGGYAGVAKRDLVIYEMHFGTFTREGTFLSAIDRLDDLVSLGVTAIEVLPLAQCSGRRNWGYDGVYLFAPANNYGSPNDFRRFVDACHGLGIAVIVDVVYNHLGPEGNYLKEFAPYFSSNHKTPWGDAFDFDGKHQTDACRFVIENARYWIQKFHVDGLRLDAVHFMFDDRERSEGILQAIRDDILQVARDVPWPIHLIGEANIYDHQLLFPSDDTGYDAIWADDIMHSIYGITRPELNLAHREYSGASDLAEALEHGYLYTGPKLSRIDDDGRRRLHGDAAGSSPDEPPRHAPRDRSYLESLVIGLQTHDCVGNHPRGLRFHQLTSIEAQKAAITLTMLYPSIPIIFMGEEIAADSPFMFFVDFGNPSLKRAVDRGRASEYPQHQWKGATSPSDYMAFRRSKCIQPPNSEMQAWYQQLISLRKQLVAQGLLAAKNLRVTCDPQKHLFGFRYDLPDVGWIQIQARICPEDAPDTAIPVPFEGELRMCSGLETDGSTAIEDVARRSAPSTIEMPNNSSLITGQFPASEATRTDSPPQPH